MKLVVRDRAVADLEHIHAWIARDSPRSADAVIDRIRMRISMLLTPGSARMGPPGLVSGTRELIQPPYVIVYRVDEANEQST